MLFISSAVGTFASGSPMLQSLTKGPIVISKEPSVNLEYSKPFSMFIKASLDTLTVSLPAELFTLSISVPSLLMLNSLSICFTLLKALSNIFSSFLSYKLMDTTVPMKNSVLDKGSLEADSLISGVFLHPLNKEAETSNESKGIISFLLLIIK